MKILNLKWILKLIIPLCLFLILITNYKLFDVLKQKPMFFLNFDIAADENFLKQIHPFKSIIINDCSSANFTLSPKCLPNLRKFDAFLINQYRSKKINIQEGCSKCLYILDTKIKVYYHTFWNVYNLNQPNRMVNLNILSYLATQNLCCTKLFVWVLEGTKNKFEKLINQTFSFYLKNDFVEVKEFLISDFCRNGFFKQAICTANLNTDLKQMHMVSLSDMIRFAILDKYGGEINFNHKNCETNVMNYLKF